MTDLSPGGLVPLTIEKPAAGGRMIARQDGRVILVAGAIPGEQVTARIERVGKGVVYATVTKVESPSPDRRDPGFDPSCGGCHYAHIAYPRQLTIKSQVIVDAFTRIGRIPIDALVPVAGSAEDGYRMRARLHVRQGRIGFFREGTHEICDARATRQLLAATCDVIDRLASGLARASGEVREIEIAENLDGSERAVHLDAVSRVDPGTLAALGTTPGVTGLSVDVRDDATRPVVIAGSPWVTDVLDLGGATVTIRRHVLAFFQGNRHLLKELTMHVVASLPEGAGVVDLYAGTGLFALSAATVRQARVTAVEGDQAAALDLRENVARNVGAVEAVHQSVEAFVTHHRPPPDALIVDPPRTGMTREAIEGAIGLGARVVVYVSCDVATLGRDARRLVDAGYALRQVRGFDLFPGTPHVETVAVFERG